MAPEALRRRMAHGNIYKADKVDAALGHYFRLGNLAALRELALLWVADRVDEDLQEYRERHDIAEPWETRDRVLVALTGAPHGGDLVRRAARMAMRTHSDLVGVHVQSGDGLSGLSGAALEQHRALLEQLGGRYIEVAGADVATALVQVARSENATELLLGASQHSRVAGLIRGSIINNVLRQSGKTLDVHIISTGEADVRRQRAPCPRLVSRTVLSRRRQATAFAIAIGGSRLLTFVLSRVRDSVGLQNALLLHLLLVVVVATVGGVWPAAVGSILAFALLNWFFAPPIHTWTIANGRDLLSLFVFLVVAGVISTLVDLAARRRSDATRARTEAQALARMAAMVLREPDPLPKLVDDLVTTFRLDGAAVLSAEREGWVIEAAAGARPPSSPAAASLAIALSDRTQLVVAGERLRAEDRQLLDAFATQLGVALETRRLQAEAANASALAKGNELRTALLAAVSHDLRTPLASIKASATSLLSDDVAFDASATRELLGTIDAEADRLNNLVANLLDMSRIQTGAVAVQARPVGLDEIVALALAGLPSAERVEVDVPENLPRVNVDAALLERAIANVVDNALTFAPDGDVVRVKAGAVAGRVQLQVADRGRGIAPADRERVFQPFQRLGDNPNGAGVGLGLAVAKGFVDAMAGELTIDDTPGGGCTMVMTLPEA